MFIIIDYNAVCVINYVKIFYLPKYLALYVKDLISSKGGIFETL